MSENKKNNFFEINDFEIKTFVIADGLLSGEHRSFFTGHSTDFKDYRNYNTGDSLKLIDWKLYGRSDKLFIKKYEEQRNITISIFLDASASMVYNSGVEKSLFAKYLAAVLAIIALKQNDKINFSFFSDEITPVLKNGMGKGAIPYILKAVKNFKFSGKTDFKKLKKEISLLKSNVIIIISDFWTELNEISEICKLGALRNDLILFQVLSDDELFFKRKGDYKLIDSETGKSYFLSTTDIAAHYKKEVNIFLNEIEKLALQNNASYLLLNTESDMKKLLYRFFMER